MVRIPASIEQLSDIYIDETSQTKHRYLILGGIIIPTKMIHDFNDQIMQKRLPQLPKGEMAWTKVSRNKLDAYKCIVDLFFENPNKYNCLDFHSLVVDTSRLKDRQFNNGSREIGFNKEIYQLCLKFHRLYNDRYFHVYPDRRNTPQSPDETRLILNRGAHSKGDKRDWPFRRMHFRDSDKTLVLQIVDILIGSIAFKLNGHYEVDTASPAKKNLCDHILAAAHVKDVFRDTAISGKFTIWHRQLR